VTAVVVIAPDDVPALRRVLEVGTFIFYVDDDSHRLALDLLEALDQSSNTNPKEKHR